jgi:hypothetical protein
LGYDNEEDLPDTYDIGIEIFDIDVAEITDFEEEQ